MQHILLKCSVNFKIQNPTYITNNGCDIYYSCNTTKSNIKDYEFFTLTNNDFIYTNEKEEKLLIIFLNWQAGLHIKIYENNVFCTENAYMIDYNGDVDHSQLK